MLALRRRSVTVAIATSLSIVAIAGLPRLDAGSATLAGTWSRTSIAALNAVPEAMAYDPGRGQLVVAAVQPGTGLPETAVLQNGAWQVSGAAILFDQPTSLVDAPALGGVVAVSGLCAAQWNGSAWSAPTCQNTNQFIPMIRGVAYDGTRGVVLVVADMNWGNCCFSEYTDTETWAWNGQAWQELNPTVEPDPVTAPEPVLACPDISCTTTADNTVLPPTGSATWDAGRRQVILAGDGGRTWAWTGSNWRGGYSPAPTDGNQAIAYDPDVATDVFYGDPDRTALWSGLVWQPVATKGVPPTAGATAYDPQLGGLVLLGNPAGTSVKPATLWVFTPGA